MPASLIQLIFRKRNTQSFSIEKVFASIYPLLEKKFTLNRQHAYTRSASPVGILKNLGYLKKIKGSVYHVTGDIHYAVFAFPRRRTILTIHDSVFLVYEKGIRRWIFKKLWLQWPVKYARVITTISGKSKAEIVSNTGCDPAKIIVIPDPVSPQINYSVKPFNQQQPVILFIGTKANKNIFRAIESLKGISCTLEIIGRLNAGQEAALKSAAISYKTFINISDEELAERYAACDMMLYPTTYEGFGLPILECQKAGRPMVTSNLSPMKEVAGPGACLVDPYNVASIREGILRIIQDASYREEVVRAGVENVKHYSAEAIAEQYSRVYDTVLLANN